MFLNPSNCGKEMYVTFKYYKDSNEKGENVRRVHRTEKRKCIEVSLTF